MRGTRRPPRCRGRRPMPPYLLRVEFLFVVAIININNLRCGGDPRSKEFRPGKVRGRPGGAETDSRGCGATSIVASCNPPMVPSGAAAQPSTALGGVAIPSPRLPSWHRPFPRFACKPSSFGGLFSQCVHHRVQPRGRVFYQTWPLNLPLPRRPAP